VSRRALVNGASVGLIGLVLVFIGTSDAANRGRVDERIVLASARAGHRSIWSVRLGGGWTRLTSPPTPARRCDCRAGEFDSHPAWSASGRRIAFVRGSRLVVTRADGTGLRVVPAPPGSEDFEPSWSARGRLAFIRQRPATRQSGYVHEIVSVDTRGRNPRIVAPPSRHAYRALAWSSDGRRLAYTIPYQNSGGPFVVGLFVVGADGGGPRFILRAAGMGEVEWSPDGSAIVLAASVPGAEPFDPYRLFTIRLSDRRIVQLTRVPFAKTGDGEPRWSPNGRLIAFTRTEPRRVAIYTVRPNGRGERRIAVDARGAVWSPDGRHVAFVEGVSGRNRSLTLTIHDLSSGRIVLRRPLRHPQDADSLGPQSWR
jgi:Tol biopolymer transport system component